MLGATRPLELLSAHIVRSERKQMITISRKLGSITIAKGISNLAYHTPKATMNMAVRCIADALEERGVIFLTVSPGWVQTDMGGVYTDLTPQESVGNMGRLFEMLGPASTRRFLNQDGSELPR